MIVFDNLCKPDLRIMKRDVMHIQNYSETLHVFLEVLLLH